MEPATGLLRVGNEKFYTLDNIAKLCVTDLSQMIKIDQDTDLLIEPSAGSGSFLHHIEPLANCVVAIDIEPEADNVIKKDFLEWDVSKMKLPKGGKIITVGNPPFGRQASLALKFIKHAATFSQYIAFILPKSFMKQSMQEKVPLNFHLIHQRELDMNAFSINNQTHYVPCVFQIWERREHLRFKVARPQPKHFEFTTQQTAHNFSLRRVGVNAGTITLYPESQKCSAQTHYFIQLLLSHSLEKIISNLRLIKFTESENTVGIKSISKREVVEKYEDILKSFL